MDRKGKQFAPKEFTPKEFTPKEFTPKEFTGALVGWHVREFDNRRLVLHMQGVQKSPPHSSEDVTDLYLVLDRNQAVQLGNNLFDLADTSPPQPPRRGWLEKLLAP